MTSLCVLKLFFLICILHFCYKWARSRAKGEKRSISQLGFGKEYGTVRSDPGSRCSKSSRSNKTKKCKKRSKKSRSRSRDRTDGQQCLRNIFAGPPRKAMVCCRSQGALARTRVSDKCLQLESGPPCPNVGVVATVACACKEQATENPVVKPASVQTVHTSKSSNSLLSVESGSDTSSSNCSCESTDESAKKYRADANTYFTTTYTTGFYSSTHETRAISSEGNETTTQTVSNFSINMEYDTEDLELECSSSSEK